MLTAMDTTLLALASGKTHRHQRSTGNVVTQSVCTRGRARAFAWLRRISLLVLFTLVFTPLVVQAAWYDNNWQYRKKITIDFTKVTGNLTNFPVLIDLATDAQLIANARADGFDILFTDDDETTKLDHERELYVSATGELI